MSVTNAVRNYTHCPVKKVCIILKELVVVAALLPRLPVATATTIIIITVVSRTAIYNHSNKNSFTDVNDK